jgi:hypothetical protein
MGTRSREREGVSPYGPWDTPAEPKRAADALQRPLGSRFQARLSRSVDMIDIATGCAKRTYQSDFWRKRCVNHHYFLICTQGKS